MINAMWFWIAKQATDLLFLVLALAAVLLFAVIAAWRERGR